MAWKKERNKASLHKMYNNSCDGSRISNSVCSTYIQSGQVVTHYLLGLLGGGGEGLWLFVVFKLGSGPSSSTGASGCRWWRLANLKYRENREERGRSPGAATGVGGSTWFSSCKASGFPEIIASRAWKSSRHNGHEDDNSRSHGSTQCWWN